MKSKHYNEIARGIACSFISFRPGGTAGCHPDREEACPICDGLFWMGLNGRVVYPFSNPPAAIEIGGEIRFFCSQECYKTAIEKLLEIISKHKNEYEEIKCPWWGISKSLNPWEHSINKQKGGPK